MRKPKLTVLEKLRAKYVKKMADPKTLMSELKGLRLQISAELLRSS